MEKVAVGLAIGGRALVLNLNDHVADLSCLTSLSPISTVNLCGFLARPRNLFARSTPAIFIHPPRSSDPKTLFNMIRPAERLH